LLFYGGVDARPPGLIFENAACCVYGTGVIVDTLPCAAPKSRAAVRQRVSYGDVAKCRFTPSAFDRLKAAAEVPCALFCSRARYALIQSAEMPAW